MLILYYGFVTDMASMTGTCFILQSNIEGTVQVHWKPANEKKFIWKPTSLSTKLILEVYIHSWVHLKKRSSPNDIKQNFTGDKKKEISLLWAAAPHVMFIMKVTAV